MKKINYSRLITAGVLILLVGIYFLVPSVNGFINGIFKIFSSAISGNNSKAVEEFISSYGPMAAAVSFALMILQSIIAPIPAFLITFANAALFGPWWGGLLSFTSSMVGATLCFFIARALGRDFVEKLTTKVGLASVDGFFKSYGKHTVLIARLLPFVSFDIVSYAAGLTSMSYGSFIIATGLGQLPATIIYSYLGSFLTGGTKVIVTGLLLIFALFTVIFMLKQIYNKKKSLKDESKI